MSANRFGHLFQITSFGESHGPALGAIIEGCPSGVTFDPSILQSALKRRRPGQHLVTSSRNESDDFEILSGVFDHKTLGTPIVVIVRNHDAKSIDYEKIKTEPRRGHADDVWKMKFDYVDHRGGGRASGRETLARVIGGAFAQMFLSDVAPELIVHALPRQIGEIAIVDSDLCLSDSARFYINEGRWNDVATMMTKLREEGDSVGGIAELQIENAPGGLGQPVFHKLKSDLAGAMMSIGAVTGVELGGGFSLASKHGKEVHVISDESVYGGIRGGISTGELISLKVAFKPTSSILDIAKRGRHDPCILFRALPVIEAMAHLVLADHILWRRLDRN